MARVEVFQVFIYYFLMANLLVFQTSKTLKHVLFYFIVQTYES